MRTGPTTASQKTAKDAKLNPQPGKSHGVGIDGGLCRPPDGLADPLGKRSRYRDAPETRDTMKNLTAVET